MEGGTVGDEQAAAWLARGSWYAWKPESPGAAGREVQVFHVEAGPSDAPVLLLVHGWPTSSIDWADTVDLLAERYRVCMLDFPGYGFSGKPRDWPYGIELDAELLLHHVRDVLGADRCRVVAHDRGASVAMVFAQLAAARGRGLALEHLALTNGNIFLPLSNLTTFQKLLLDPAHAPEVLGLLTPEALAEGLGSSTFTPPRPAADPTVAALAATFAYNHGTAVMHDTIQYLRERAEHEERWLRALASSDVPTTVIWGLCDTVSPPRVALHVWETFLRSKPGSNEMWFVPDAGHYLHNDRPGVLADVVLRSLDRDAAALEPPGPVGDGPGAPIRVDRSEPSLRAATDVLLA